MTREQKAMKEWNGMGKSEKGIMLLDMQDPNFIEQNEQARKTADSAVVLFNADISSGVNKNIESKHYSLGGLLMRPNYLLTIEANNAFNDISYKEKSSATFIAVTLNNGKEVLIALTYRIEHT